MPLQPQTDALRSVGLKAGEGEWRDIVPGEQPSGIPGPLKPVAKIFGLYDEPHERRVRELIDMQGLFKQGWSQSVIKAGKESALVGMPSLGEIQGLYGGQLPFAPVPEQMNLVQPLAEGFQGPPSERVPLVRPEAKATALQAEFVKQAMSGQVVSPGQPFLPPSLMKPPKELTAKEEIVEIGGIGYQPQRNENGTITLSPLAGQTAKPPEPPKPVSDENRIALEKYGKGFQELDQKQMHQVNTQLFDQTKTLNDFRVTAQAMAQVAIAEQVAEIQQRARNKVDQEIRVAGPRQILKQWDDLFAQVKRPNAPDLFLKEGAGYFAQLKNGGKIWLENMQGIDDRLAMMEAIGTGFRANYVRLTGDVGNFSAVEQENASRYLIPRIWTPADPLRAPDSYERAKKKIDLLRQFVTVVENAAGNPANVKIATRAQLLEILGQAQLVDRAGQQKEIQDLIEKAKPK